MQNDSIGTESCSIADLAVQADGQEGLRALIAKRKPVFLP
jgi:hypothetical protein